MAALTQSLLTSLLLAFAGVSVVHANVIPKDTFRLANQALDKGAVDDAIQLYQSIADQGFGSLPLFYNLGSAYASNENWAPARLYLERAHLEDPLNVQVQQNLEHVKDLIDDPYHFPRYPLFSFIELIHSKSGPNTLSWMLLLAMLFFITGLFLRFVFRFNHAQLMLGLTFSLLIVIVVILFFEQTYLRFHDRMVILYEASSLHISPDQYAETVAELNQGHKLRIMEDLGPWIQVDCADGTQGWIASAKVKPLKKG